MFVGGPACHVPKNKYDGCVQDCRPDHFEEHSTEDITGREQGKRSADAERDQRCFVWFKAAPAWNWNANSVTHADWLSLADCDAGSSPRTRAQRQSTSE